MLASGATDESLETLTWYDAAGQTIKVDGEQLAKTSYDRVGRPTHQFVLAYGVAKGASAGDSRIGHGGLLWKVQYPDSSGGTDVVTRSLMPVSR